jgi:phosphoribosyl-ATP pyrophosphohydrolase/phosphoribosyl-AMP cyclohydrolase
MKLAGFFVSQQHISNRGRSRTGAGEITKEAGLTMSETKTGTEATARSEATPTIDFNKMDGLAPGIVQDARTGEVLMLGYLNPISYAKTLETGFVTFWSRTRQKLWMKGETSGNRLRVISASTDCDNDTLLFKVEVEGDGLVCHEGTVSCFTRPIATGNENSKGENRG